MARRNEAELFKRLLAVGVEIVEGGPGTHYAVVRDSAGTCVAFEGA